MIMDMQELKKCKTILIEVNQKCNLNCTYCFYRDYGRISDTLNLNQINNMLEQCPNANQFYLTGGECFASPIIEEIINILSEKGKVIAFTNGVMLDLFDEDKLDRIIQKVDRFIISFDSFDYKNYICRKSLDKTMNTMKKIISKCPEKLEVKVCITLFNYKKIGEIFASLIDIGVKYLSINFIFDIKNTSIKHEVYNLEDLNKIFNIIMKYKKYFNMKYIEVLYDLYINNKINDKFPCLADSEYYYYDCTGKFLICPGNCKILGNRENWNECFSKECANEWEIMYER